MLRWLGLFALGMVLSHPRVRRDYAEFCRLWDALRVR